MKKTKYCSAAMIVIIGLSTFILFGHALPQEPLIKRVELQRHDLNIAGKEMVQFRIDFEHGATFGRHSHPGGEIIYVLEGVLEYQVDGRIPVKLKAGGVLFIPAGTIHAAKNIGGTRAKELATYIVEKGLPLVNLAKGK